VATGSCAPRTLRTDQLERRLAGELERTLDLTGLRVACPNRIVIERGDVFGCVATASDGDRLRIIVRQVDDDGSVTWETAPVAE
jgi:Domain of unknown function (DUF4333)